MNRKRCRSPVFRCGSEMRRQKERRTPNDNKDEMPGPTSGRCATPGFAASGVSVTVTQIKPRMTEAKASIVGAHHPEVRRKASPTSGQDKSRSNDVRIIFESLQHPAMRIERNGSLSASEIPIHSPTGVLSRSIRGSLLCFMFHRPDVGRTRNTRFFVILRPRMEYLILVRCASFVHLEYHLPCILAAFFVCAPFCTIGTASTGRGGFSVATKRPDTSRSFHEKLVNIVYWIGMRIA